MLSTRSIISKTSTVNASRLSLSTSTLYFNHNINHDFNQLSNSRRTITVLSPARNKVADATSTLKSDPSKVKIQMTKSSGGTKHLEDYLLFHPVYTPEELESVKIVHREAKTASDKVAAFMVSFMRGIFDMVTRYPSHKQKFPRVADSDAVRDTPRRGQIQAAQNALDQTSSKDLEVDQRKKIQDKLDEHPSEMGLQEMRKKGIVFGPEQWLIRMVFLESIAGCPGMVAAVCRHLHSLRLLRRDQGWIHEMLRDAENERMHLLTFLKLAKPGIFMRTALLGAQGVFFNFFFILYLAAPKLAHRFVGYLEEEAVVTYTNVIKEMEEGRLPEWDNLDAPNIAIDYWKLNKDAKLLDVIKSIRADEATHRFINHTFASLDQKADMNPFVHGEANPDVRGSKYGFEREESHAFLAEQKEKKLSILKEESK